MHGSKQIKFYDFSEYFRGQICFGQIWTYLADMPGNGGITLRPELSRNAANREILGFVEFREMCPFVIFNDTVATIALRLFGGIGCIRLESHEYCQDSIKIYKNIFENTARFEYTESKYESCTNKRKVVTVLDNS